MSETDPQHATPPPTFIYGATRDWPGYFASVAGKPARETLLFAGSKPRESLALRI